ncbi:hypothetical protein GGX14DRAFT_665368 [Mycena pura]|uniref:Uncharacterized protein n=1 Tax=Mycena pura TaxID=153505 RepID=A0AAD6V3W9_9AGAR|nr:hypothetical protein GGX14DRAFT_665368 [Mycena pura]
MRETLPECQPPCNRQPPCNLFLPSFHDRDSRPQSFNFSVSIVRRLHCGRCCSLLLLVVFAHLNAHRTSAKSRSDPLPRHSSFRSVLKPLRLVEKLVAANVIAPFQAPKKVAVLRKLVKKPRLSLQDTKTAPQSRISIPPRLSPCEAPRLSLTGRTSTARKKAPFVVPLHYSATKAVPTTSRLSSPRNKSGIHGPAKQALIPKPVFVAPPVSRLPIAKTRVRSTIQPSKVGVKVNAHAEKASRSRISDFVYVARRPVEGFTPSPLSRYGNSRIPRLRYTPSCTSSRSSATLSVAGFNFRTPTPSPAARQAALKARKAAARKTEEEVKKGFDTDTCSEQARLVSSEVAECPVTGFEADRMAVKSSPSLGNVELMDDAQNADPGSPASNIALSTNPVCVVEESGPCDMSAAQSTDAVPTKHRSFESALCVLQQRQEDTLSCKTGPAERSDVSTACSVTYSSPSKVASASCHQPSEETRAVGMLDVLIGELKSKLVGKKPTTAKYVGSPSPTKGTFVIINKSDCGQSVKENALATSELQQAFARRRASTPGTFCTVPVKQTIQTALEHRRPLAPVLRQASANTSGDAHRSSNPPSPPPSAAFSSHVPGREVGASSPGAGSTAKATTKTEMTAFGARRVRRLVVPPMVVGSMPSRDPRIIMELDCLRAQKKVAGGKNRTLT